MCAIEIKIETLQTDPGIETRSASCVHKIVA